MLCHIITRFSTFLRAAAVFVHEPSLISCGGSCLFIWRSGILGAVAVVAAVDVVAVAAAIVVVVAVTDAVDPVDVDTVVLYRVRIRLVDSENDNTGFTEITTKCEFQICFSCTKV